MNFSIGFPLCLLFTMILLEFSDFTAVGTLGSGAGVVDVEGTLALVSVDGFVNELDPALAVLVCTLFLDCIPEVDGKFGT